VHESETASGGGKEVRGVVVHENDLQCTRHKTQRVVECKSGQQAVARAVPEVVECELGQRVAAREVTGVVEHKNDLQHARCATSLVVVHESGQWDVVREGQDSEWWQEK
jgi:hypothetical protein